jgi:beta-lactamase class D
MPRSRAVSPASLLPLAVFAALAACAPAKPRVEGAASSPPSAASASAKAAQCPAVLEGADAISARGVEGTFVLRDETTGCSRATDPALADTPFLPASTFKIPNTLIGLETGVIRGPSHAFKWDGVKREYPDWNQDLDLGGALKFSCVPCFQSVARGVGEARMKDWLHKLGYGNEVTTPAIDAFWLTGGGLRISPRAQTEFLHRMSTFQIPVEPEHVEATWRLLEIERIDAPDGLAIWRGKTGLGAQDGRALGWLVGRVERGDRRWTYALFVRETGPDGKRLVPMRKELARELLVRLQVLPKG